MTRQVRLFKVLRYQGVAREEFWQTIAQLMILHCVMSELLHALKRKLKAILLQWIGESERSVVDISPNSLLQSNACVHWRAMLLRKGYNICMSAMTINIL